jgi:LPS sulfotransferase NodH
MNTGDAQAIRFLFVLSTERSGSTLLSFMLGAHSGVISPPELHLLAYPTFNDWRRQYPGAIKSLNFLLASCGRGMDKTRMEAQFGGQTTEFVYRWIASQENVQPRIIVDKTPKYARDLAVLQRTAKLEPLYIWLIRHPLGVAASKIALRLERRKQRGSGLLSCMKYPLHRVRTALRKRQDVCAEVAYWSRVNTQIEQFLATIDSRRKQQVHFEQLVKEPRSVMDRLCQWLDIPFEPATLDPQAHLPTVLEPKLVIPR